MTMFLICIILVLVGALVGVYRRLSPLQAFSDERKARQGMQVGRAETVGTEGEEVLKRLRSQIRELSETIHLERSTANHREDLLKAERVASQAVCAQYQATCLALEVLCVELDAERVDYREILDRCFGQARVEQIRVRAKQERALSEKPAALVDDEREGNRDTDARMIPPPAPKPGDPDGDATEVMDVGQQAIQRALGQAAQEELHGVDGVPEAAPGRHLDPSLETPGKSWLTERKAST